MRRCGATALAVCCLAVLAEAAAVAVKSQATVVAAQDTEHGRCELCMTAVQQVQYGQLPACGGGDKAAGYSSCSQVVQSMLAYAADVMHLLAYGCYKYSPYHGWQTVKPCPAHVLCGRMPNIFDEERAAHCPTDFHYRFPHALGQVPASARNPLLKYWDGAVDRGQERAAAAPKGGAMNDTGSHPLATGHEYGVDEVRKLVAEALDKTMSELH